MKFLLTNDDGAAAPGIAALHRAVSRWGQAVVVAPHEPVSGCGHQVTVHRPLSVTSLGGGWHAVDAMPADCVRIGLAGLAADADWVIAGINQGGNLGADVYLSGTVAAAREACLLGKPAIAISHYYRGAIDWPEAEQMAADIILRLVEQTPPPGSFWNVNLPMRPAGKPSPTTVLCELDPHPLPVDYELLEGQWHYRGSYHDRKRRPGSDVDLCFRGQITITRIALWSNGPVGLRVVGNPLADPGR